MNLHEQIAADLDNVFLNLDEFACLHDFNGKKVKCIVDDQQNMAATGAANGFANVTGIGILQCDRVVYCQAADLAPQPLPGEKIIMDGREWYVSESGLSETEGLLALPLNRAF